eukprot:symbB.v1.2.032341.t1/scaffold3774.1/size50569/1
MPTEEELSDEPLLHLESGGRSRRFATAEKILQRRCWTKPVVSVVPRDLDAFEIGRGAFVEAVERCDKAHAWQHALSLHQLMLEEGYGYSLSGFHALLMKEQEQAFASASRQKLQNWQRAVHSLELMNLYDIFPSSITISLLISCCRRGNEWRWPLTFMMSHLEETKKGTHQLTGQGLQGIQVGRDLPGIQRHGGGCNDEGFRSEMAEVPGAFVRIFSLTCRDHIRHLGV